MMEMMVHFNKMKEMEQTRTAQDKEMKRLKKQMKKYQNQTQHLKRMVKSQRVCDHLYTILFSKQMNNFAYRVFLCRFLKMLT